MFEFVEKDFWINENVSFDEKFCFGLYKVSWELFYCVFFVVDENVVVGISFNVVVCYDFRFVFEG